MCEKNHLHAEELYKHTKKGKKWNKDNKHMMIMKSLFLINCV